MAKPIHRLTEREVNEAILSAKEVRLSDGGGLTMQIKRGSPSWVFRYVAPGTKRERYLGLGSARKVTLTEARRLAASYREQVAQSRDPVGERHQEPEPTEAPTFKDAALRYIDNHRSSWKNIKHAAQWRSSLEHYAFPSLGHLLVRDITTKEVANTLKPIWMDKRETAARVRGRTEMIIAAEIAAGHRIAANPAAWDVQRHLLPLQRRKGSVKHHAALPYSQMPLFFKELMSDQSGPSLLLQFIILTSARYAEAARANWSEVRGDVWNVPGERMKARVPHVVPLTPAALAVLKEAKKRHGDVGMIFPGKKHGKPYSDSALAQTLDRHTIEPATTHGMRSAFRDWAGDCTDAPREVAEMCLAHTVGGEVENAYRRSTALDKRRELMNAWAQHCLREV